MREVPALQRRFAARRTPLRWSATIGVWAVAAALAAPALAQTSPPGQNRQSQAAQAGGGQQQQLSQTATRLVAHGQREQAARLAQARPAGDPSAAAILGRLAADRGEYDQALAALRPAVEAHPTSEAALELGLLQLTLGRKAEGRDTLTRIVDAAPAFRTVGEVVRLARAARALGQFRSANSLFREADGLTPNDPAVNTAWGDLFLEKHNRADAERSYQAALAADPQWAPAHAGLARTLTEDNPPAAAAEAAKALDIDAALVDPHLLRAELALDNDHDADATEAVEAALAVNPKSEDAHALLAAMAYVDGRTADFDAEVARVLAVNPAGSVAYRVPGEFAARRYRFDEAAALARRAIALDPGDTRAQADLGMHLLRTGDEAGARQVLERAFAADPYDVVTFNLLSLLDSLDDFKTFTDGAALVRLDAKEADVLKPYALPIVTRALAALSQEYQFTPAGPILVEIFPKHDDFAVRTLGLPGMLGALGACFGRVVTLDSPRARPPGAFNWQSTLWHELAHVYTLQLSKQRVPRWLTEGASVYEEGRVHAEWARDMELPFAQWYQRGEVPKIRDLNAGFTKPTTIALAYFQASLVVAEIVDAHGYAGLRALLVAYGDGLDTEQALERALGTSLDALQAAFDRRLAARFGPIARALAVPDTVKLAEVKDAATARGLAAQYPGSYPVQLAAGRVLAAAGDRDAAFAALERAATLVPTATGSDSPHGVMAALALKEGDRARAMQELRTLLTNDHTNVEAARELAALAGRGGRPGPPVVRRGAPRHRRPVRTGRPHDLRPPGARAARPPGRHARVRGGARRRPRGPGGRALRPGRDLPGGRAQGGREATGPGGARDRAHLRARPDAAAQGRGRAVAARQ